MTTVVFCELPATAAPVIHAEQELGDESPLNLIDGHAKIEDDDAADLLVRRRSNVYLASAHPDGDAAYFETCDVVKQDGEVCGRDLPCRYHSED